jgi:hypothetical protein
LVNKKAESRRQKAETRITSAFCPGSLLIIHVFKNPQKIGRNAQPCHAERSEASLQFLEWCGIQ